VQSVHINERQVPGSGKRGVNDREWVVPRAAVSDHLKTFSVIDVSIRFY
jgi:hypothetical protein